MYVCMYTVVIKFYMSLNVHMKQTRMTAMSRNFELWIKLQFNFIPTCRAQMEHKIDWQSQWLTWCVFIQGVCGTTVWQWYVDVLLSRNLSWITVRTFAETAYFFRWLVILRTKSHASSIALKLKVRIITGVFPCVYVSLCILFMQTIN